MPDTAEFSVTPSGAAQRLLNDPLLNKILDEMERDAIETVIRDNPSDDETHWTHILTVRAIRSLRQQLKSRAAGETKSVNRVPVA